MLVMSSLAYIFYELLDVISKLSKYVAVVFFLVCGRLSSCCLIYDFAVPFLKVPHYI
jgi:hypothetical protein